MSRKHAMTARLTPDGRLSLPAELRRRHGLERGTKFIIEDTGDAIVLRTSSQLMADIQAMSRKLLEGKPPASVDDFLADRRREAAEE